MFAKSLRFWLFFTLLASMGYAADSSVIAVLEVVVADDSDAGDADSDGEGGALELTVQQTRFLTDELRKQATLTLAKNYVVLTREKIIELSASVPESAANVVDIGRAMKSDYVTSSSLSYLGDLLVFTVELYNCESGLMIADFVKMAKDLKGLLDIVHENAPILFKKINPPPATPAATAVAMPANEQPASIPVNIPASETKIKNTNWLAIGLEVAGVAAIGFGLSQFTAGNNYYDKYKDRNYFKADRKAAYEDAKSAKTLSTISYIAGGVLLASGITIHILF
jgi:hypothetical protein